MVVVGGTGGGSHGLRRAGSGTGNRLSLTAGLSPRFRLSRRGAFSPLRLRRAWVCTGRCHSSGLRPAERPLPWVGG
ncbi:hypothetical protein T261_05374 [Streptomyces lydicus]|nr:hypothetical protein T261_05374 [Streptomyces lydicus]